MDSQRCQNEWDSAMRDPKVKKGEDCFGNKTVAKLFTQILDQGRRVENANKIQEQVAHEINDKDDLGKLAAGGSVSMSASQIALQVSSLGAGWTSSWVLVICAAVASNLFTYREGLPPRLGSA